MELPLPQNLIYWLSLTAALEQSLRALWDAASRAAVLILPQTKLNLQLLSCTFFFGGGGNICNPSSRGKSHLIGPKITAKIWQSEVFPFGLLCRITPSPLLPWWLFFTTYSTKIFFNLVGAQRALKENHTAWLREAYQPLSIVSSSAATFMCLIKPNGGGKVPGGSVVRHAFPAEGTV